MTLATFLLAAVCTLSLFAVPPLSPDALKKTADVIVVAKVAKVEETTRKTDAQFVDTVYSISLDVITVEKGKPKAGATIVAKTYQPRERPAGWAGPQGQNAIPEVGSTVRAFLSATPEATYQFRLPNGIEVVTPTTKPTTRPS